MQKDGEFKEELITSMEECENRIGRSMTHAFYILIPIGALIFFHLCTVAYTHWKNFGKPAEHQEQVDDEPEENNSN